MKYILVSFAMILGLFLVSASAQSGSVSGEWDGSMNTPGGARPMKLKFKVDGEKLTGTVQRSSGDVALEGTIKGKAISFSYTITYNDHALTMLFTGKVDGDTMSGNVSFGGNGDDTWTAKRSQPAKK